MQWVHVFEELKRSRLLFKVGKKNVLPLIDQAMQRVDELTGTSIPAELKDKA